MLVLVLVDVLEEVCVDGIRVDARKRDDKVRREPVVSLNREHRREFSLNVFKHSERDHVLEWMEFFADNDPFFNKTEMVQGRLLGGVGASAAAAMTISAASR